MATGRLDILIAAKDEASRELNKAGGTASALENKIVSLGKAISLVFLSKKALDFAKDSVAAFSVQEDAITKLNASLKASGNFTTENSAALQGLAAELQKTTRFGDEATIEMLALVTSLTGSAEAAETLAPGIQDLSAALGIDLQSAANLVSKAVAGNVGALSRYGIQVEKGVTQTETLANVQAALNNQFGGAAAAQVDTYSGRLEQLQNAYGDLQETIGSVLAPILQEVFEDGTDLITDMNTELIKIIGGFGAFDSVIALLVDKYGGVGGAIKTIIFGGEEGRAGLTADIGALIDRSIAEAVASISDNVEDGVTGGARESQDEVVKVFKAAAGSMFDEPEKILGNFTPTLQDKIDDIFASAGKSTAESFAELDAELSERLQRIEREFGREVAGSINQAFSGAGGLVALGITEAFEAAAPETAELFGDNIAAAIINGIIQIAGDPEFFDKLTPAVGELVKNIIGLVIPELIQNIGPLIIAIIDGLGAGFEMLGKRLFSQEFWVETGREFRNAMIEAFGGSFQEFGTQLGESVMEIWPTVTAEFGRTFSKELGDSLIDLPFDEMGNRIGMGLLGLADDIGREIRNGIGDIGLGGGNGGVISGTGTPLDAFQHGTAFVPRTGAFMLHRGEAVVPADQAAQPATVNIQVNAPDFVRNLVVDIADTINNLPEGQLLKQVIVS